MRLLPLLPTAAPVECGCPAGCPSDWPAGDTVLQSNQDPHGMFMVGRMTYGAKPALSLGLLLMLVSDSGRFATFLQPWDSERWTKVISLQGRAPTETTSCFVLFSPSLSRSSSHQFFFPIFSPPVLPQSSYSPDASEHLLCAEVQGERARASVSKT